VLLYDGECGVCAASVQWLLRHEQQPRLRFAPLQSTLGRELRRASGVPREVDALVVVEQGSTAGPQAVWASRAVARALRESGGAARLLGGLLSLLPRALADAGYRLVARHRQRLAPRACLVPTPAQRARFLER
jgi:predicted DCC family thiol-disulfide oxidoreductase YuxK